MNNKIAKVICHTPPGQVELRDCPLDPLRDGQLLLKTLYSAISPGTELRCLRGQQPGARPGPFVPGYQSIGQIVSVGPNCGRKIGDIVFNANASGYGEGLHAMWGAHSSYIIASQDSVVDLPDGIKLEQAALAKLAAIALHGLKVGKVTAGERVAVIGLGPLGQLSARLATVLGAQVVAFDRVQKRTALATQSGVNAVTVTGDIKEAAARYGWPSEEFDAIIDVTGVPQLVDEFISLARDLLPWDAPAKPATRYIIQGSYPGNAAFDYQNAFLKELAVFLPRDHHRSDIKEVLQLIASDRLQIESIIGNVVLPEEAPHIYKELASDASHRLTAVFDWSRLD